jgi:hypothetical protein
MANTFKRKTVANIDTTLVAVYTVPASTTTVVLGCTLANISSSSITASIRLVNSGDDTYIIKDIPIPSGSSVEVMAGNKVVMEPSDILQVQGSIINSLDATLSIMEMG